MGSASQWLMALAFLSLFILPLASSTDATDLEKYLDCLTNKKVDIIFVFDTSGSMGGEINELRAIATDFANDLNASHIDQRLGLVEFRDFPKTCNWASCGEPGDFAYRVKGDGNLTGNISTFGSWLNELKAGGGGDDPEAILAALRHAMSDCLWRDDAEKAIILLTDAGPHPDGDCCNAEGDTLEGTIFELAGEGAKVYVIGPDNEALKKIAGDTGGSFHTIRSGMSLKPLLKKITGALSCSFKVEANASCVNRTLEAQVRLVGKEVIPYVAGQTEVWMYLNQTENRSHYNLSYDQAAKAYLVEVPGACGQMELTFYGRVGERSAVQSVKIDCGSCEAEGPAQKVSNQSTETVELTSNAPPVINSLTPDKTSSQATGSVITLTANASDSDGDQILYRFFLNDEPVTNWTAENTWAWSASEAGSFRIEAQVRDGKHAGSNGMDDRRTTSFEITAPNSLPVINSLTSDKTSPQDVGAAITWVADAIDPDNDPILYRFFIDDEPVTDWIADSRWIWTTSKSDIGSVEVRIRDGMHAGPNGFDDRQSKSFVINEPNTIPTISTLTTNKISPQDADTIITWTADARDLDNDPILYRFFLGDEPVTDWQTQKEWTWSASDAGLYQIKVQVRDGKHAGKDGYDDFRSASFNIRTPIDSWQKTFGGLNADWCTSVQQTSDGGYIISAITESFGAGGADVWLIKTDSSGNKVWDKTFGGSINDRAYSVQQTSDGGYIIAARTGESEQYPGGKAWLIKTDPSGNKIWDKTFGEISYSYAHSVQQTNDGGYVVAVATEDGDAWLLKTDSQGNMLWKKPFQGSTAIDQGDEAWQTTDGGYIIITGGISGNPGVMLTKTDSAGNTRWDKTFSRSDYDRTDSVQQTSDGGYIIAGRSSGAWLIKTDSAGNKVWDQIFNGWGSVQQTADGGYIIAASTTGGDIWLIKTDANGSISPSNS